VNGLARSWLYVPGDDSRKIAKAATVGADVVILDLEDGVPGDRKREARDTVRGALQQTDFGRSKRFVRVSAPPGPDWQEELAATLPGKPDGYVIAKASSPETVQSVAGFLRAEGGIGVDREGPPLAAIVTEDVEGVLAAERTIAADPAVRFVFWGTEDLSASLGAWRVMDEQGELLDVFRFVRSLVMLHAVRLRIPLIDTPWLQIADLDGLRREAERSAWMGMAGKQVIHPSHVAIVNEAFVPTDRDRAEAEAIVGTLEAQHGGAARVNGAMADPPHLLRARHVLELIAAANEHSPIDA
jgi:citrate lyase subunit beta/citryl-CoA lyase